MGVHHILELLVARAGWDAAASRAAAEALVQPLLLHFAPAVLTAVRRDCKPRHAGRQLREVEAVQQYLGPMAATWDAAECVEDGSKLTAMLAGFVVATVSIAGAAT
jgi:hypothetical protein